MGNSKRIPQPDNDSVEDANAVDMGNVDLHAPDGGGVRGGTVSRPPTRGEGEGGIEGDVVSSPMAT